MESKELLRQGIISRITEGFHLGYTKSYIDILVRNLYRRDATLMVDSGKLEEKDISPFMRRVNKLVDLVWKEDFDNLPRPSAN